MKYDVEGHSLLSKEAAKLDGDILTEHNELAEILLELNADILYENDEFGNWGDDVLRFVVLQVNHQVANFPIGFNQTSSSVGPLSDTFRSRADGAQFTVSPLVAEGLESLLLAYAAAHVVGSTDDDTEGYLVLRSLRNASTNT